MLIDILIDFLLSKVLKVRGAIRAGQGTTGAKFILYSFEIRRCYQNQYQFNNVYYEMIYQILRIG